MWPHLKSMMRQAWSGIRCHFGNNCFKEIWFELSVCRMLRHKYIFCKYIYKLNDGWAHLANQNCLNGLQKPSWRSVCTLFQLVFALIITLRRRLRVCASILQMYEMSKCKSCYGDHTCCWLLGVAFALGFKLRNGLLHNETDSGWPFCIAIVDRDSYIFFRVFPFIDDFKGTMLNHAKNF